MAHVMHEDFSRETVDSMRRPGYLEIVNLAPRKVVHEGWSYWPYVIRFHPFICLFSHRLFA